MPLDTHANWTPMDGLRTWATSMPDTTYLVQPIDGETTSFTWADVDAQSSTVGGYLQSLGFETGDRVAVMSKNCAWSVITELAIWRAGFVSVPIYPSLAADSIAYILEHSDARALFIGELDDWPAMRDGIPDALPKVTLPIFRESPPPGTKPWNAVIDQGLTVVESQPADSDLARLIYTSGSTGRPKGVMVSYGAMAAASDILLNLTDVGPDDRMISYLPLAHVFEAAVVLVSSLRFGFQVYFSEGLQTFPVDLKRARPTIFLSVPRLWVKFQQAVQQKIGQDQLDAMLANPATADAVKTKVLESLGLQDARVAVTGSAPLAPSIMQWYRSIGLELLEGYGMSEDFAHSHCSRPGNSRIGYVGPPNKGVQGRISAEGEIQVRSPGCMLGYFKDEAKTAEAFTEDGWFRTGDLGEYDAEGRLRITGRLKELFKTSKGKYVAPAPIENKLGHAYIEASCVSGANCPQPHVLIMPSEAARTHLQDESGRQRIADAIVELIDAVNATLDPHEQLAFGVVIHEPWTVTNGLLTPTLKIKRPQLEERYLPHVDGWYESRERLLWM